MARPDRRGGDRAPQLSLVRSIAREDVGNVVEAAGEAVAPRPPVVRDRTHPRSAAERLAWRKVGGDATQMVGALCVLASAALGRRLSAADLDGLTDEQWRKVADNG